MFGDVTSPKFGIIGHGVNCQGVMGSGVALTIRQKFPKAYEEYKKLCDEAGDRHNLLGTTQIVKVAPMLYVANMFTQFSFGGDGEQYATIQAVREACSSLQVGRDKLVAEYHKEEQEEIFAKVLELFPQRMLVPGDTYNTLESVESRVRRTIENMVVDIHRVHPVLKNNSFSSMYPVHLPLIGCGLGGLEWDAVRPSIYSHTGEIPVTIYHYQK